MIAMKRTPEWLRCNKAIRAAVSKGGLHASLSDNRRQLSLV